MGKREESVVARTVVVVGATGAVGQVLLEVLAERDFPVGELRPAASGRSAGGAVRFRGEDIPLREPAPELFDGADLAFFCVGADVARALAPAAVERGCLVIDKSSAFRLDPDVPLVVPEVNGDALARHRGIIASPNCSTIQLVMALFPLDRRFGVERVVVSSYQSVSGTGRDAVQELLEQTRAALAGERTEPSVYPRPIAFNVLPQCDDLDAEGYTVEERKFVNESRKILARPDLRVTATAVRVPVLVGHAEAVNLECRHPVTVDAARAALEAMPGVVVRDDPARAEYPTPLDAAGKDDVLVGRIRLDPTVPHGLNLWIVADNLRKGAASNAVDIAEACIRAKML